MSQPYFRTSGKLYWSFPARPPTEAQSNDVRYEPQSNDVRYVPRKAPENVAINSRSPRKTFTSCAFKTTFAAVAMPESFPEVLAEGGPDPAKLATL